jgi:lipoate-protein ligase A
LAQWGIQATLATRSEHPAVCHEPFLCFQRRSTGDVLVAGSKIAGSAQRRSRGAVLQHGSVLLARSAAAPQLAGLEDVSGQAIPPDRLIEAWLIRLAGVLSATWQDVPLSVAERHRATALSAEKYASPVWTEHRGRVP